MGSPKPSARATAPPVLDELQAAIAARGETREEAERALQVGKGYLSHVFAGSYRPGRDIAARIHERYGVAATRWTKPKSVRAKRRRGTAASERHQTA
jgi:transcriptional regulator with XRE-family HTH domain